MMASSHRPPGIAPAPARVPEYCTVGDMLCEVRVWSQERWDATPAKQRPVMAERVPGLGWVVAAPAGRDPAPPS